MCWKGEEGINGGQETMMLQRSLFEYKFVAEEKKESREDFKDDFQSEEICSKNMSVMEKTLDGLRMRHYQYSAVAVITCFTGIQLFSLLERMRRSPEHIDVGHESSFVPNSSLTISMLHLGSFGANFGAQMWVTFVAGLTMFYSLPRHMFGKVQSRLFPMFFLWSLVCSAITLSTYLSRHPVHTWDSLISVQISILSACFLMAAFNALVVSPAIVCAMLTTFEAEVKAGVGDVIGHTDANELKKDPEYMKSYKQFRRCHGISAMLVVASLVCNVVYLYFLASHCTNV